MHPDGPVKGCQYGEEGREARIVERQAVYVGEDLNAQRAEVADRPLGFGDGRVRVVHRQRCREAQKAVRMPRDQRGDLVVREARQVARNRGFAERLDGRRGQREHLAVPVEAVHDAEALVEVVKARDRRDALLHVRRALRAGSHHPHEVRLWDDVREGVDPHGG